MTVNEALAHAHAHLSPFDAKTVVSRTLDRNAAWLIAHCNDALSADDAARIQDAVAKRATGVPQAYVDGHAEFYGRTFTVDANVLVPRPETELLVDEALALHARDTALNILDVGTGSGALAVTLAALYINASVTAVDISEQALAIASRNAISNGVAQRCRFVVSDLLSGLSASERYDLVVANLPYVPTAAIAAKPDPVGFEPRLALDGGDDGLDLYRRLLPQLPGHVRGGALVVMEAAPPTIDGLFALACAAFPDAEITVGKDYAGLVRYVRVKQPD